MKQTTTSQSTPQRIDENILVVKRSVILSENEWQGLHETDFSQFQTIVTAHAEFHPRSLMEEDDRYKQIIPYLIFRHGTTYFMMQRDAKSSEQRLKNKFTLGIGGHVRQEDLSEGADLFTWAQREFHEEISYTGSMTAQPLGLINDDSNAVGRVHLGCVFLLTGTTDQIAIKSELASGKLVPLTHCQEQFDQFESWSQYCIKVLEKAHLSPY